MKIRTLLISFAASLFVGMSANADLIIDLEGEEANGNGFNVFTVNNADASQVTGISFNFVYDAGVSGSNISWGSELLVQIGHLPTNAFAQIGTQDESCDAFGVICEVDLMWDDAPGVFSAAGGFNLQPPGNPADGSGNWEILIADSFDDGGADADGVFLAGSYIRIEQLAVAVPEPGTLLLMGLGLVGLGFARRRRHA